MVQPWHDRLVSAEFGVWVTNWSSARGDIFWLEVTIVIPKGDDVQERAAGFDAS